MTDVDDAQTRDAVILPAAMLDRLEIRELIENWVLWRDAGDWDRFATVWHDDGIMYATWCQASATDFIAASRKTFAAGAIGLHSLGGASIDVRGSRAVARTKMQINGRAAVDGVVVNLVCVGRFFDTFEKRKGRWGMVVRQPVYELDWLSPVDPSATVTLDADLLASYPEGYRHLAYIQTKQGFDVSKTLPGTRGSAIDTLNQRMDAWLTGTDSSAKG